MQVVDFIKDNGWEGLDSLGIKTKVYEDHDLTVLNYSQIDSPKTHPIVRECRGLILQTSTLHVLCKPFKRFYNHGEVPEMSKDFDFDWAIVYEKIDGSLIKIWYNPIQELWNCGTRGTAFAEGCPNGFDTTFAELVYRALGVTDALAFHELCEKFLPHKEITYLFELTSMENRIVTRYEGTKLWYLGAVDNVLQSSDNYEEYDSYPTIEQACVDLGAHAVKEYHFNSIENCIEIVATLPDLKEGYVVLDQVNRIREKIKSPAYVAVHHLRGEGLNPKRIKQLVLTNEQAEYLKYWPEDSKYIEPTVKNLKEMLWDIYNEWEWSKKIESQKDFALAVKDYAFSPVLFNARRDDVDPQLAWKSLDRRDQYKIFCAYLIKTGREK